MENLEWYPFFYNGLETNIEATKCGRLRKEKKDWYGNKSGKSNIVYGEINFNSLKLSSSGYIQIGIMIKNNPKRTVLAHQIIASIFHNYNFGSHKIVVDHIDSNKLNNSYLNLRIVSQRENSSKELSIKSGFPTGVSYMKKANRYISRIYCKNKLIYLGCFKNQQEASQAYQTALNNL